MALALLLEAVLNEPTDKWHPVAWLGRGINRVEGLLRHPRSSARAVVAWGFIGWSLVMVFALAGGAAFISAGSGNQLLLSGFSVLLVWLAIAPKSLGATARRVKTSVGEPDRARGELSRIVGRATAGLDEERVCAAAVESVAENTVDALVAPVFYAILFGPLGAVGYRAINTLDSMWGYRNETYENFGKVAARADDVANFLPARLTVALLYLVNLLRTGRRRGVLAAALRYGHCHPSINSGLPEAAMAGALNIRLGGPVSYGPLSHERPFICPEGKGAAPDDVDKAVDILHGVWFVLLMAAAVGGLSGLFA